jgi:hypothetical protein
MDYFKKSLAWSIAVGMVVWTAVIITFSFGPRIETALFPVVADVKATLVSFRSEDEIMHIAAVGNKKRQCEWKDITAQVYRDGQWHQGFISFTDPKYGPPQTKLPTSRPTGPQSLGEIWVFPTGERVQVYLWHNCHPLWRTMTFLYELDFSEKPFQVK